MTIQNDKNRQININQIMTETDLGDVSITKVTHDFVIVLRRDCPWEMSVLQR